MQDFKRGTARANQLTFEYLTQGEGLLALCVHGFPDSPYSYRYLLPALAEAGYRAVAPFNRGFAPTELPADRHHIHSSTMAADQIALHEALGGDSDAILIAHDWGAVGAWGAAGKEPGRWRRCVVLNIPPFAIFGENIVTYDQIKRSFYFWYFQNQRALCQGPHQGRHPTRRVRGIPLASPGRCRCAIPAAGCSDAVHERGRSSSPAAGRVPLCAGSGHHRALTGSCGRQGQRLMRQRMARKVMLAGSKPCRA